MDIVKRSNYFPSSFFDDFLTKDLFDWSGRTNEGVSIPKVNIIESNVDFQVIMAAPGMRKEDFQIELDNDILVIQSDKTNDSSTSEDQTYTRKEFGYNSFKRSLHLPNTVMVEDIKANYKDGLLTLVIPKKEEARKKPVRTIKIS